MAPENQMKEGISNKQKVIGVLFILVLIVIVYQVMGIFKNDSGGTTVITPTPAPTNNAAAAAGNKPVTSMPPSNVPVAHPMPSNVQPINQPASQIREASVSMEPRIVDIQKQTQQKYLEQINQLQSLKIQREIAETNQAIASAKLATVTAEKSVSDLLTRPTQTLPSTLTAGTYTMAPSGPPAALQEANVPAPPQEPVPVAEVPYTVVSVSMELGRWSAVLSFQGKLYHVSVGDVIPLDGSVVAAINKNGVMLTRDGKRRKISMVSSV